MTDPTSTAPDSAGLPRFAEPPPRPTGEDYVCDCGDVMARWLWR